MLNKLIIFGVLVLNLSINGIFAKIVFGSCPSPPSIPNFTTDQYAGRWYEIQHFPVYFQTGLDCVTADYGLVSATDITVYNQGINLNTQKITSINGTGNVPDITSPNRLVITFPIKVAGFTLFTNKGNYDVWATDFSTYSLVYSCTNYFGIIRSETAWILSRTKQLDPSKIDMLVNIFKNGSVDPSAFVTDKQVCNN